MLLTATSNKVVTFAIVISFMITNSNGKYYPNWQSLDSRPLPSWYDEGKLGIFNHWGLYSVPSLTSEWFVWFWKGLNRSTEVEFMRANFRPDFQYADFAPMFTAELFNSTVLAQLIANSGARYI